MRLEICLMRIPTWEWGLVTIPRTILDMKDKIVELWGPVALPTHLPAIRDSLPHCVELDTLASGWGVGPVDHMLPHGTCRPILVLRERDGATLSDASGNLTGRD